ncbi:MAG: hypothetical protein UV98_C0004G0002 [Parcubacteria group bacterium GW2011_GWB1_43_6]|nr:MAG: hypothetical protein UV98_C0004G0002 [Parcubacteria group bacterium GW2011_GWB1_43_6]
MRAYNEDAMAGPKILIIEDDKFLRDLIIQKLKKELVPATEEFYA